MPRREPADIMLTRLSEIHLHSRQFHQWVGNNEQGHYHRRLGLSESPYFLSLQWRENRDAPVYPVGCYELNLAALLKAGYIREDGVDSVRVRFVHAEDGAILLQARRNAPSLYVGTVHGKPDRNNEYRTIVKSVFQEVAAMTPSAENVRTELVCDETIGHYHLGEIGWQEKKRIDNVFLHADVMDGKVWVQHDGTDLTLVEMLEREGIPKEHIVLAFHSPDERIYTGYAVS